MYTKEVLLLLVVGFVLSCDAHGRGWSWSWGGGGRRSSGSRGRGVGSRGGWGGGWGDGGWSSGGWATQKESFGICDSDTDCQARFVCGSSRQCEYQQPRPVPCIDGACGWWNYRYTCNRQNNTCQPRGTQGCGRFCASEADCTVLESESVPRTCNNVTRRCEWNMPDCLADQENPESYICPQGMYCKISYWWGTRTCKFERPRMTPVPVPPVVVPVPPVVVPVPPVVVPVPPVVVPVPPVVVPVPPVEVPAPQGPIPIIP